MSRRLALLTTLVLGLTALPAPGRAAAEIPLPVTQTLPNGLRIAVFPRPGVGFVQVQLSIAAGTGAETEAQRGVAPLVAKALRMGTSSRSAEAFGKDANRLGGNFAAAAQRENAAIGAAFLPEDFDAGVELMSDAVINPIFDEGALAQLRDQGVRELVRLHLDPVATAEEQLWPWALPGIPAAHEPLGDLSVLFGLTRESLRTFHRDHYRPDQAVLAIAGDITPEHAFAVAGEWFGRWAGKGVAPPKGALAAVPAGTRILLVDRPDLAAASVRMGWALPGRDASDDVARTLAVSLFDDVLRSRLAPHLPAQSGLAVGFGQLESASLIDVRFTVRSDSVPGAIQRVKRAVREAREVAPDAGRLRSIEEQIRAAYPMRFSTVGGALTQWLAADATGPDPRATLTSYPDRVAAVTAATAEAALRRRWDLDRTAVVVVGSAAKLRRPLARLGTVKVVKLDQPPKAAADTMAAPTAEELKLGRQRVNASIAAHGGLDSLKAIRDIISEARIRIVLQGRELHGELRQLRKEPMRMVYLTRFESFESRQVLNGDHAWSMSPTGALQDADSVGVRALQNGFSSDVPHLLLTAADPTTKLAARGTVRIGGQELWAIDMEPARGPLRRLYLDPKTSLLAAMDQREVGARGANSLARRLYRDMRKVGGLQLPFEEERQLDGVTVMNIYMTRLQVNAGIADDEFQRPAGSPSTPTGR